MTAAMHRGRRSERGSMTEPAFEDRPPPLVITPELRQLSAELAGMPESRREILLGSLSPNGWPARWARWYDRPGAWPAFKSLCREVWMNESVGIEPIYTILAREDDRKANGL